MTATLIPPGAPEFVALFDRFRTSAFRLETLQSYGASGEDADVTAFLAGDPVPADPGHDAWLDMIRRNTAGGRTMRRVHVVLEPLSAYMRYELCWPYALCTAAGENIGIVSTPSGLWPSGLPVVGTDFWLFDSAELYEQRYDDQGRWLGTEHIADSARVDQACWWRTIASKQAVPWANYMAGHPDLADRVPVTA